MQKRFTSRSRVSDVVCLNMRVTRQIKLEPNESEKTWIPYFAMQ